MCPPNPAECTAGCRARSWFWMGTYVTVSHYRDTVEMWGREWWNLKWKSCVGAKLKVQQSVHGEEWKKGLLSAPVDGWLRREWDQLGAAICWNPYGAGVGENDFPLSRGLQGLVSTKLWPLHRTALVLDASSDVWLIFLSGLFRISEVKRGDITPDDAGFGRITRSWFLASVNAGRLKFYVCFPLFFGLRSVFFLSCTGPCSVGVEQFSCSDDRLLNLSWTSPPLSSVYLLPLVPLGYVKCLHSEKSEVIVNPSALPLQPMETKTVSCHLHAICIGSPVTVRNVRRPN